MYDYIVAKALRESYPTAMVTSVRAYTRGNVTTVDADILLPLRITIDIEEGELVNLKEENGSVAV